MKWKFPLWEKPSDFLMFSKIFNGDPLFRLNLLKLSVVKAKANSVIEFLCNFCPFLQRIISGHSLEIDGEKLHFYLTF